MSQTTARAADQRGKVDRILNDSRVKARQRLISAWRHILAHELETGTQFLITKPDGALYAVLGSGEVFPLPRAGRGGDRWHAYFNSMYGLNEHETSAKFLYDALRAHVGRNGQCVEMRRFAAYDLMTQTAYMSAYNGRMYKIDGGEILEVQSGEDGIFFADDDGGTHVTPNVGEHGLLFRRLVDLNFSPAGLSGITPDQQRMAIIIWMFALALPDMMPTKPLLIVEGAPGSGKSAAVALMQLALMGIARPMILQKNKEDDFGVVLLRSPIAIFDNQDAYIDWIPDAVCSYTTTGMWHKRKLFTDDESVTLKPHAFIAIASKNPASFRREDTADRCIIVRLERREEFTRYQQLQTEIQDERHILLGEYMWYVNRIVAQLRADATGGMPAPNEKHRMADFASLGRVVGRVLGWTANDVEELMAALQNERDAFANEEDPLVDLLHRWISYPVRFGPRNVGRMLSLYELHTELGNIAQGNGIPWNYSPRTLAQKLRSPHVEREFRIDMTSTKSIKSYRIWRLSDPQLEVVMDNVCNIEEG